MPDNFQDKTALISPAQPALYADVIIPVYLPRLLTWSVPEHLSEKVMPGIRVEVQVGKSKRYAGIVKQVHNRQPGPYQVKPILAVLDESPVIPELQLRFWQWMASYYCCTEGEIMVAALPAHLKLSSESVLQFNENHTVGIHELTDREYLIAEALEVKQQLTLAEVQALLDTSHVYGIIKKLVEKGVVTIWETLSDKYKVKTETYVILAPQYRNEQELEKLIREWGKAPRQLDLLLAFLHYDRTEGQVTKSALLKKAGASSALLDGLAGKGILQLEKRQVDRLPQLPRIISTSFSLSSAQQAALASLEEQLPRFPATLLHGVTGSGKTLLYIELLAREIAAGKQCLYLLPEIALTSQIIHKLRQHLGGHVGVYHSKFNSNERMELWNKVLAGELQVVVGPRSALFLPFQQLSLIIVDEEHDASFKQAEPSPRYQARDAAIYFAGLTGARVLLGSATPSLETYFHCKTGKYGLVVLKERYGDIRLPEINLIDLKQLPESRKGKVLISEAMEQSIRSTLAAGKQVIVFQNRRGYSPYQVCGTCGWIPKCDHCDVSLTYHKSMQKLKCHYCGTTYSLAKTCKACGLQEFRQKNFGTEQLEELLGNLFPDAAVARMDTDSVQGKYSHENLIRQFEEQRIQILAGTQMVVKGLDFDHVGLVCIPDADGILRFADFRASERAFQLIEQVSGRAGRKGEQGKVMIQLLDTNAPVMAFLFSHDYEGFFEAELEKRKTFGYPPFSRIIMLRCRHVHRDTCFMGGNTLVSLLSARYKSYVSGPAEPPIGRIRNEYIVEIMLKLPRQGALLQEVKQYIREAITEMQHQEAFRRVRVSVDVDPQ